MNRELPDVQAGFRKGRGTRDQIANIRWIIENAREFQKNIYFCFIDYAMDFSSQFTTCLKRSKTTFLTQEKKKKVKVLVDQSCPSLCDPIGCSLPGFSVTI